jgi:hypothetical protein
MSSIAPAGADVLTPRLETASHYLDPWFEVTIGPGNAGGPGPIMGEASNTWGRLMGQIAVPNVWEVDHACSGGLWFAEGRD